MKIDNLREFAVFARYLNFTAAARHLYVSQPSLSYRIAAMEKELGFTLVDRDEPIRLTPAGKAFLAEATAIVEHYDQTVAECRALASRPSGKLTVEHPTGMPAASGVFDALLADFVRRHPGADVRCTRSDGRRLRSLLLEGSVDAGVIFDRDCLDETLADDSERPVSDAPASVFRTVELPRHPDARLYALVPSTDELSCREHLFCRDLDGRNLAFQMDPRFASGRAFIQKALAEHGANVRFADKTERDDVDFAWNLSTDELIVSDAGIVAMCQAGMLSNPPRVALPLEDDGLVVTPLLVFLASNPNPLLAEFAAFAQNAATAPATPA